MLKHDICFYMVFGLWNAKEFVFLCIVEYTYSLLNVGMNFATITIFQIQIYGLMCFSENYLNFRYTMLQLFLSEPKWIDCNANDESAKQRKSLLSELESVIQSLLSSGGRSEARLWLCNTLSGISSISLHRQHELFLSLLTSKPTKQHLAAQLLQLIFDKKPQKVGPIIAKKSYTLQDFFRGK